MDYVYPSHEGHDPARATGLLPPAAVGTVLASVRLRGHSGPSRRRTDPASTHDWGANAT